MDRFINQVKSFLNRHEQTGGQGPHPDAIPRPPGPVVLEHAPDR